MLSRIDFRKIVIAHYNSLSSLNSGRISLGDILLFIFVPILLSFGLIYYNISIQKQIGNLITMMSILAGFLFNLLAIIHASLGKIKQRIKKKNEEQDSIKFRFANEIHANISYNILIAMFLIIFLVIFAFDINFNDKFYNYVLTQLFNFICLFLLLHFTLTLLMILNRIYILLDKEDE
jgi:hypothetical protein